MLGNGDLLDRKKMPADCPLQQSTVCPLLPGTDRPVFRCGPQCSLWGKTNVSDFLLMNRRGDDPGFWCGKICWIRDQNHLAHVSPNRKMLISGRNGNASGVLTCQD